MKLKDYMTINHAMEKETVTIKYKEYIRTVVPTSLITTGAGRRLLKAYEFDKRTPRGKLVKENSGYKSYYLHELEVTDD